MSFAAAAIAQGKTCAALGSPFMGRLMPLLAMRLAPGSPVADKVLGWKGDVSSAGHSVPLRLAGALHRLVLSGADPALAAAYPPNQVDDEQLWAAVKQAMQAHTDSLLSWLDSPPQTNEIRRSGVVIAAAHWLTAYFGLPLMVSELGASAGLNLNWNRYAMKAGDMLFGPHDATVILSPEWNGLLPPATRPVVVERRGVDLCPFDTSHEADRQRLLSYLWPDQPERLALTRAALTLPRPRIDTGDAAEWLEKRLDRQHNGQAHMIFNTIAWQYFPPEIQARARAALERAGARASTRCPLAHFSMEADGHTPGAALTMRLWPGPETFSLGRTDFHGRWTNWDQGLMPASENP